jgi:(p)ppGpp synthase/HD superfamily hydrolase
MTKLTTKAFEFAKEKHAGQVRRYTGEPYINHCFAVAALVAIVPWHTEEMLAAAILHDTIEDTDTTHQELIETFGHTIADLVLDLTDQIPLSAGNRAVRKKLEAERIALTDKEAQTIKVADLIDNTASISAHDPGFAKVYLKEKAYLLSVLTLADKDLVGIALKQMEGT